MKKIILILLTFFVIVTISAATPDTFSKGPQIKDFGPTAEVDSDLELGNDLVLKVAFDVGEQAKADSINSSFNSLARFINMHVRAGVKPENIQLALVVHGKATYDVMHNEAFKKKFATDNPNHALLNELLENNVDIYLCGQSAAYYQVTKEHLHSGVKMSLSAMTAHALLQQQGYTLNPF